jgi:hypothetical protein
MRLRRWSRWIGRRHRVGAGRSGFRPGRHRVRDLRICARQHEQHLGIGERPLTMTPGFARANSPDRSDGEEYARVLRARSYASRENPER